MIYSNWVEKSNQLRLLGEVKQENFHHHTNNVFTYRSLGSESLLRRFALPPLPLWQVSTPGSPLSSPTLPRVSRDLSQLNLPPTTSHCHQHYLQWSVDAVHCQLARASQTRSQATCHNKPASTALILLTATNRSALRFHLTITFL